MADEDPSTPPDDDPWNIPLCDPWRRESPEHAPASDTPTPIKHDAAIPFFQAKEILRQRWGADVVEFTTWLVQERLHVFLPDAAGTRSQCVPLGELTERDGLTTEGRLAQFRYSRDEIESFDPADNRHDATAEIRYRAGSFDGWFNPSGRYVSLDDAVRFLSPDPDNRVSVLAVLRKEFQDGRLLAFQSPNWIISDSTRKLPEDGYFIEGQIVGLAHDEFGTSVTAWDAISLPDASASPITQNDAAGQEDNLNDYQKAILEAIDDLRYQRLEIPYGGKKAVSAWLGEHRNNLFSEKAFCSGGTFEKAWISLGDKGLKLIKVLRCPKP